MRPLRFLLIIATCIVAFILLLYIGPWGASAQEDIEERSTFGAYFNWRAPSSLFPPSAIISLTDDNSTFFLARPAAFGPLLPSKSLSGQLWVGSGFGDDHLGRGGPGAGAEGELGCSDIPEWDDGQYRSNTGSRRTGDMKIDVVDAQDITGGKSRRSMAAEAEEDEDEDDKTPTEDDGTDDHLHHPLSPSNGLKTKGEAAGNRRKPTHADIQSLQEGAEIAGKVVLLSRGGCGFLEKAKWVQRRGGVALIVGDDIRGGPLVTMYARGDTSNVTIPALFTSHTTAHLLSSLIPSGGILDDLSAEESARLGLALGDQSESGKTGDAEGVIEKPNFTTTSVAVKGTSTAKPQQKDKTLRTAGSRDDRREDSADQAEVSWLRSLFKGGNAQSRRTDSRRPPSSGNIGWVLQEDFEEEDIGNSKVGKQPTTSTSPAAATTKTSEQDGGDGFVIGVQDWRDPDLVAEQRERQQSTKSSSTSSGVPQRSNAPKLAALKGGSITPGSGEYGKAQHEAVDLVSSGKSSKESSNARTEDKHSDDSGNWFTRLFRTHRDLHKSDLTTKKTQAMTPVPASRPVHEQNQVTEGLQHHEGLWVTLTPTSMSSSPFFDTLLVLVVSPLVTLTIVYALLLLRSRIRRRRWRAPKSVVERLPVRTYQTMPSPTTATSPSTTSPVSTPITATTPLLPTGARPIHPRSRPRSRTTSEVPVQQSSPLHSDGMAAPSLEQIEEKRAAGLAEWRRRYGGKQRECVVCLEEYVDGVSRVMSLPCGHEFHAECMYVYCPPLKLSRFFLSLPIELADSVLRSTPWLTTRRRTCPICKGDVVRSLACSANSSSAVSPPHPQQQQQPQQPVPYRDDDSETEEAEEEEEEDVQEQAAVTRNDDPVAALPVSREDEAFEDLERGMVGIGGDVGSSGDRTR